MRLGSFLEGFWKRLEANLGVLGGFESHFRAPQAGPGLILTGSKGVLASQAVLWQAKERENKQLKLKISSIRQRL